MENKCTNILWRFYLAAVLTFGLIRSTTNLIKRGLDVFRKRGFVIFRSECGNFYANCDFPVTKFIQEIVYLFHFLSWGSCICKDLILLELNWTRKRFTVGLKSFEEATMKAGANLLPAYTKN
ncbi:hypothetical protein IC582_023029 [Cucumis melo]